MMVHSMAASKLILLVDDDTDWLEIARITLEAAGYQVICCMDAQQARASLDSRLPDLIVTDLMMRSLHEGFGLAKELKADPKTNRIPIVLSTGIARQMGVTFKPTGESDLVAMGVEAFLEKPVRPPALLATVRQLLGDVGT
jgi:CheY-like chemotaxis protein